MLVYRRRLVILGTAGAGLIAVLAALLLTPYYRAEALLASSSSDGGASLAGLSSQLAGLGGLLGPLPGPQGDRKIEAVATLQSRALTEAYIADQNLLPILFRRKWDERAGAWKAADPTDHPTPWDGNKAFSRLRSVTEDKKTGLVRISIEWSDPVLAARWVGDLVRRTNEVLRDRATARSEANIRFLNEELASTQVVEVRQALYKVLEGELKNMMLARGDADYAFKIIDPPVVPQEKSRPQRVLLCLGGTFVGLAISVFFALLLGRPAD